MPLSPACPAAPANPGILTPGNEFTVAELYAMALDGVVANVFGQAFRAVAEPESAALRAAALAHQIPPALANRAALARLSAAWVYGCAPPPRLISLAISSAHRSTALPPWSGCELHEVRLDSCDVLRLGGALLTTAVRTAVDVAIHEPPETARAVLLAMAVRTELHCPLGRVLTALANTVHIPGKRQAQQLLEDLLHPGAPGGVAAGVYE